MNTVQLTKEQLPSTELSRLSVLDRLALHWGLAMIRWVERPRHTGELIALNAFDPIEHCRELVEARSRVAALR